jgi:multiple sugar transport system substrate-binding protein
MVTRKISRAVAVLLAIALAFAMAACSSGKETGNADSGTSKQPVKLRITWAGSQARHDATLKALELYTKNNPHVTFEPEYMGWDTYYTKLAAQSASKTLPDIMQMDVDNIVEYGLRNQFADLSEGIDASSVDKNLIDGGKVNGKLYGFPLASTANTMMYNKVALEKLGVKVPEGGFTWDELVEVARSIKPKLEKGKYVIEDLSVGIGTAEIYKYEIYQLAQGKGFSHTNDGKFNIDKDTFLQFYKLFAQLRKEGIVPPIDVTVAYKEFDPMMDHLLNGTILFMRNHAAGFGAFDSVKPGEFAMMTVPRGKQSGEYPLVPSQFFTVSANSKYIEEAKRFIEWCVNDLEAGKALSMTRGVPVSPKVRDAILPKLTAGEKMQIEMNEKAAKDANPFASRPKGYGAWTDEFPRISQEVAFGRKTPEQAYEDLKKKYAEIVK